MAVFELLERRLLRKPNQEWPLRTPSVVASRFGYNRIGAISLNNYKAVRAREDERSDSVCLAPVPFFVDDTRFYLQGTW